MKSAERQRRKYDPVLVIVLGLITVGTVLLGRIIQTMPARTAGLETLVGANLDIAGVASPVTAVLLNFRGYDTFLEIIVLLLAVIAVWSMTPATIPSGIKHPISPILLGITRLLVPLMIIIGAYLIWQGGFLAGGAFQAGAVFGGAGIMMMVAELPWLVYMPSRPLRLLLIAGPTVFLIVGLGCMLLEGAFLFYPRSWSGPILLIIETFCAISIGVTLTALFAGGRPPDTGRRSKWRASAFFSQRKKA